MYSFQFLIFVKLFSISQCAARRTRHRAFYFGGWWQTSGGTQKTAQKKSQNNCKKRDGRQVGERKKQPQIH
jgi:hypothetical protein